MARQQNNVKAQYPEVGTLKTEKELKKVYKKLTDAQLDEWLALEGWTDEYKPTESEPINRMRKCMVILYKHFPKEPSKKKGGSVWKQYSLEQLIVMATDNECMPEFTDHESIMRMRLIMALKGKGITG